MKQAEIALRRVTRVIGITALSAELGVGRQHLYKVIAGERRSPRIERVLSERGIRLPHRAGKERA